MKQFILILTFAFLSVHTKAQDKNFIDQPYVEVNGSADTAVVPDEIYININISEADVKNKISIEEMERKMVEGLISLGINIDKQLSAKDMQSNFRFYALKQKDVLKSKEYILKVGDGKMATRVFIKLEELGISNSNIDHVAYSKMNELKNQLRTKAALNAKHKALALSVPLGSTIEKVLHIVDYNNDTDAEQKSMYLTSAIMVRGVSTMPKNEEVADINFEKIKVNMNVSVKFALK
jgi:hypothetical protein